MSLAPGTTLQGRYRVLARLGEGGMGSVYQVEDLARPGVVWAVKELLDDSTASPEDIAWAHRRFDTEIQLMRQLQHPRIPRFVNAFVENGRRYFVMEFIPGANLEDRLARSRAPLPERDVLRWMVDICDVLTYLHNHHPPIIVRDLKPGNIMVTPSGEARLIDFGIARTYKPGKIGNTENLGTMTYASPEHLGQAQTDARSDIYSLGATMYHLLTNAEPTPMETPAPGSLRRLQPSLSAATEDAVIRAMRLDPAARFAAAAEMRDTLAGCLNAIAPAPRGPQSQRRNQPVVLPRGATAAVPAVSRISSTAPAARAPHAPAVQRAPATRVALPESGVLCPRCGYLNRQGARFCTRDGVPLSGAVAPGATHTASRSAAAAAPSASPTQSRTGVSASIGGTAELNHQRATDALTAGRYIQAVRQGEAALAKGRATYDVYMLLGRAYVNLGRAGEAADAFAQAARLRPTSEALAAEGEARRTIHQPETALLAFTRARQLDPRNPDISYQLGATCLELGRLAEAEGELRDALELRPHHAPTLVAIGRLHAMRKEWDDALARLREATECDPPDATAYMELGRALLALQRPAEAVRALERAAQLAPASAEVQTALGVGLSAVGRRDAARKALRRAVELDATNNEARQLLKQM